LQTILAVGGGSTIDTAKAIRARIMFGDFDVKDAEAPLGAPTLIAVPTLPGSGSETSRFFVLSDPDTRAKRARRGWCYAPDLAVLDPDWLTGAPPRALLLGAFDAFCHLWETFICKNERSPVTDMLAATGIANIAQAMRELLDTGTLSQKSCSALQLASALGGYAISNVRVGMIHALGEPLSAYVTLAHPETLWVFYSHVRAHYDDVIQDRITLLNNALGGQALSQLDQLWARGFRELGVDARIRDALGASDVTADALVNAAMRDTVLLKEHPKDITWDGVHDLTARALRAA
ncbi:MAG TPA: hypothetical protein DCL48_13515, partial [Alphaproteobacteria bacterium]|nr:hypothetical protein [Alphaproteobacteria bacterium]